MLTRSADSTVLTNQPHSLQRVEKNHDSKESLFLVIVLEEPIVRWRSLEAAGMLKIILLGCPLEQSYYVASTELQCLHLAETAALYECADLLQLPDSESWHFAVNWASLATPFASVADILGSCWRLFVGLSTKQFDQMKRWMKYNYRSKGEGGRRVFITGKRTWNDWGQRIKPLRLINATGLSLNTLRIVETINIFN